MNCHDNDVLNCPHQLPLWALVALFFPNDLIARTRADHLTQASQSELLPWELGMGSPVSDLRPRRLPSSAVLSSVWQRVGLMRRKEPSDHKMARAPPRRSRVQFPGSLKMAMVSLLDFTEGSHSHKINSSFLFPSAWGWAPAIILYLQQPHGSTRKLSPHVLHECTEHPLVPRPEDPEGVAALKDHEETVGARTCPQIYQWPVTSPGGAT